VSAFWIVKTRFKEEAKEYVHVILEDDPIILGLDLQYIQKAIKRE